MQPSSMVRLRRHSPWLILALAAAIIFGTLALTLLWPLGRLALGDNASQGGLATGLSSYQGPQQCAECHPNEFHDWSGTTHAQASFDPIFQEYMQQAEEPGECFACHTTGYNSAQTIQRALRRLSPGATGRRHRGARGRTRHHRPLLHGSCQHLHPVPRYAARA